MRIRNLRSEQFICFLTFSLYYVGMMIFDLNEDYLFISHALFLWIAIVVSALFMHRAQVYLIKPYLFFMSLYILVSIFSSIFGIDLTNSSIFIITLVKILLMCILLYQILYRIMSDTNIEKLFYYIGICFFVWVIYIYGASGFFSAFTGNAMRLGAEVSHENVMGTNAALICSCLLYYVINKHRYVYLPIIGMMLLLVAVSGSKKALFALPIAIVLIIFFKYGLRRFYKTIAVVLVLVALTPFVLQLPIFTMVNERVGIFIMQLKGNDIDSSTAVRTQMIRSGLVWFTESPIIGVGIDNYKVLYARTFGEYRYAHNNYIELLVDIGVVGFLCYYSMYIYLLFKLNRMRNQGDSPQILFMILLIQLFFDIAAVSYLSKLTYIHLIMAFVYVDKAYKLHKVKMVSPAMIHNRCA